jgi:hypothetical protein
MMKISSPLGKIKLAVWLSAALATGAAGCAAPLGEAPFPLRPDTPLPGDLRGPFDGRVVDAATGRPIPGALVWAAWGFEVGRGLAGPAGSVSDGVETDSDGRYWIAPLRAWPGRRTRLASFTLIVYKPGYVAYRSDRRFDDLGVRHDFVQSGNLARLERFAAGLSHVRHVRFVGGGGALRRALAGEAVQASLELSGAAPTERAAAATPGAPLLDASGLLSEDELRAVTRFEGPLATERLGDLPQTPSYDSKHFRAEGKPESFDAAIRIWKLAPEAAEARYGTLLKEVPHAEPKDELGDRSLRGYDGRILAAAVLDREHGLAIELTCGVDLCRDAAQAVSLLRRVLGRAQRIGQAATTAPPPAPEPETPAPTEKPPAEENPFQLRPPELHR